MYIVFEDTDCEGNLYNFKDVMFDSAEKCVKAQLAMCDDRLPYKDGSTPKVLRNTRLADGSKVMKVFGHQSGKGG